MKKFIIKKPFFVSLILTVLFLTIFAFDVSAYADKLADAIAKTPQGSEKGMIDPDAKQGFLGIPGAPDVNLLWAFLWAIWVGWIFSTVGAFGGIMAGVGHITIFGLGDYAKSFKSTNSVLNKLLTDSIRVSNQWLVSISALISSINYYRMGRLVLPLGIALAAGSVAGSILVPIATAGKIKLSEYIGYFGICVFIIGGFLFYETTERGRSKKKNARAAAKAFEEAHIKLKNNEAVDTSQHGVKIIGWGLSRIRFTFYGVEFSFRPIIPVIGGFFIAALASFLGIGGGFLFVPFLTSIAGLPMFLVAGTSALTVLVGMIVSIFSYMAIKGVVVYWPLIGIELFGIFVGSMLGPRTSRYIPDIWLKRLFVVLAMYVGIRYTSKGFLGHSIVPPF
ncbi:MAG: sulfite exporter TauE/SafE family protein [Thermodesulfovibrionia bacterium]|nr:sulfite exporter TauE/SafE family protein [Thermodesulfovibrionia bacterium]